MADERQRLLRAAARALLAAGCSGAALRVPDARQAEVQLGEPIWLPGEEQAPLPQQWPEALVWRHRPDGGMRCHVALRDDEGPLLALSLVAPPGSAPVPGPVLGLLLLGLSRQRAQAARRRHLVIVSAIETALSGAADGRIEAVLATLLSAFPDSWIELSFDESAGPFRCGAAELHAGDLAATLARLGDLARRQHRAWYGEGLQRLVPGVPADLSAAIQPLGSPATGLLTVLSPRPLPAGDLELLAHLGQRLAQLGPPVPPSTLPQALAADLHDRVAPLLSSMGLIAESLPQAWRRSPDEANRRSARLAELAQRAFAEVRTLAHGLSAPRREAGATTRRQRGLVGSQQVREHGLAGAVRQHVALSCLDDVSVLLDFEHYQPQPEAVEQALLLVCQEAVSNALRHGHARRITLAARLDDGEVSLRIEDDGIGMAGARPEGIGCMSLRQRVANIGGRIDWHSPGRGTVVDVRVPADRDRGTRPAVDHQQREGDRK